MLRSAACLAALIVTTAVPILTSAELWPATPILAPGALLPATPILASGAMLPVTPILTSGALPPAPAKPAFSLGILRRDGVLLPFAAFNGRDWTIPWPDSDSGQLPINLDDVPKKWWGPVPPGAPWTALMTEDGTRRPLKIEKPQQVRVFCDGRLGLLTDYKGEAVDSRAPGIPKDGLAAASEPDPLPLQPIVDVSLVSPDATNLVKSMTPAFNKQEKVAAEKFLNWGHPYSAEERTALPIELEAMYRFHEQTPRGEWLLSFIEAIRRFPARPEDNGCGLITFVHGWVVQLPGIKPEFYLSATVTYCDREGVAFMLPLGHLSAVGENYWVYQMSSWRDEEYTVARVRPDEVRPVVSFFGGGCPK
jgi:hypothetical protein